MALRFTAHDSSATIANMFNELGVDTNFNIIVDEKLLTKNDKDVWTANLLPGEDPNEIDTIYRRHNGDEKDKDGNRYFSSSNFNINLGFLKNPDGTINEDKMRDIHHVCELTTRNLNKCDSLYFGLVANTLFKRNSSPLNYHNEFDGNIKFLKNSMYEFDKFAFYSLLDWYEKIYRNTGDSPKDFLGLNDEAETRLLRDRHYEHTLDLLYFGSRFNNPDRESNNVEEMAMGVRFYRKPRVDVGTDRYRITGGGGNDMDDIEIILNMINEDQKEEYRPVFQKFIEEQKEIEAQIQAEIQSGLKSSVGRKTVELKDALSAKDIITTLIRSLQDAELYNESVGAKVTTLLEELQEIEAEKRAAAGGSLKGGANDVTLAWIQHCGINIFYLLNVLYNFGVMGRRISPNKFKLEPYDEWASVFLEERLGVSDEDERNKIDMSEFKFLKIYLEFIIKFVNANDEVLSTGHLVDRKKPSSGVYNGYMDTSSDIFNHDLFGRESELYKLIWQGVPMARTIFETDFIGLHGGNTHFGGYTSQENRVLDTHKINGISFNDIVSVVQGNSNDSNLVGGKTSIQTSKYEGKLLVNKLNSYMNNILSAFQSKGYKLESNDVDDLKRSIEKIEMIVYLLEETMGKMATYINAKDKNPSGFTRTVNIGEVLKTYVDNVKKLKSEVRGFSDSASKLTILINH